MIIIWINTDNLLNMSYLFISDSSGFTTQNGIFGANFSTGSCNNAYKSTSVYTENLTKKNTASLRCYWAFKTQTKLKQTYKSHKVRRNQTEKCSKKDEKISFFLRNLQISHCLSGLQGCEKIEKSTSA
jgi:hypothetical protein